MSAKTSRMPHDFEAEQAVLATCMLDPEAVDEAAEVVGEGDWYSPRHGHIWEAILRVHRDGRVADTVTLRDALSGAGKLKAAGGDEYLIELGGRLREPNLRSHAEIVRDKALLRRLVGVCGDVYARGMQPIDDVRAFIDEAEASVFRAAESRHAAGGPVHVRDVLIERVKSLQEASQAPDGLQGLPTGFPKLDDMLCGLKPGELILVAGRPGMGKSAMAGGLVGLACEHESPALVFSLEMPRAQWIDRMLAGWSGVDAGRLRTARLTGDDWSDLQKTAASLAKWPLFIDDEPGVSLMAMRSRARRIRNKHGLSVMVIDYLQLARSGGKHDSREQEVAEISRGLKGLAKELEIPIIALAQLNRSCEARGDKRPTIADLRESGQLEQDADVIMFLYRDEVYNRKSEDAGLAEIIVGKQRSGPTGTVMARFDARRTRFLPLAQEYDANEFRDPQAGGTDWEDRAYQQARREGR